MWKLDPGGLVPTMALLPQCLRHMPDSLINGSGSNDRHSACSFGIKTRSPDPQQPGLLTSILTYIKPQTLHHISTFVSNLFSLNRIGFLNFSAYIHEEHSCYIWKILAVNGQLHKGKKKLAEVKCLSFLSHFSFHCLSYSCCILLL